MSEMNGNLNENRRNTDKEVGSETLFTASTVTIDEKKIKKSKKKSMLKMQKRLICVLLVAVIVLGASAAIVHKIVSRDTFVDTKGDGEKYYVMQKGGVWVITDRDEYTLSKTADGKHYITNAGNIVDVDEETGDVSYYAYVDPEGTEQVGVNDRLLIFPHTEKSKIQEIEVHNTHGSYTFERKKMDDGSTDFVIEDYEEIPYDLELFAQLVVTTGYTLTMQKIDNELVKQYGHKEYGLVEEERVDEEGNTYTYKPSWYKLTDTSGNVYKVTIGNKIPSNAGYYVKYEGRDSVYIVTNTGMDTTVLATLESLCTPTISIPSAMADYYDVTNFIYWNDPTPISDPLGVQPLITFDYLDLDERNLTEFQTTPYFPFSEITAKDEDGKEIKYDVTPKIGGYFVNEYSVDELLQMLYLLPSRESGVTVAALGVTEDDLADYGLDKPAYRMMYSYKDILHDICFSAKTERGTYYCLSAIYDMIVEIDQKYLDFFEWKDTKWMSYDFIQFNIAFVKELEVQNSEFHYTFLCDNSKSDLSEKVMSDKMEVVVKETGEKVDTEQFRDFFISMVWSQFEGESDLTDEEVKALLADESNLMLTVRYETEARKREMKFYRYSERRAYVTVNGVGGLYVLVPQVEKLASDANKVLTGEPIDGESKYD